MIPKLAEGNCSGRPGSFKKKKERFRPFIPDTAEYIRICTKTMKNRKDHPAAAFTYGLQSAFSVLSALSIWTRAR